MIGFEMRKMTAVLSTDGWEHWWRCWECRRFARKDVWFWAYLIHSEQISYHTKHKSIPDSPLSKTLQCLPILLKIKEKSSQCLIKLYTSWLPTFPLISSASPPPSSQYTGATLALLLSLQDYPAWILLRAFLGVFSAWNTLSSDHSHTLLPHLLQLLLKYLCRRVK